MTLPQLCLGNQGAAPTLDELTSVLATVPSCAISCLANSVLQANCSVTDAQCVCVEQYAQITDLATPCIMSACSLTDALFTKNLTETVCNRPVRDRRGQYDAMNLSTGIIASLIIFVRLLYKQFCSYQRKLSYDDWAMLASLLLGVPCTVLNTVGLTAHGLGKDIWTLPPPTITAFVGYFFILEVFYLAEMAIIKLSLSLFYLAIFPGKKIRRLLIGTCILNVLYGMAFVLAGIFACTPVSRYWTQYVEKDSTGHCIDLNLFAWLHGGFNIVLDVWMIAIPLSQVKSFQMHWKKKCGVIIMFLMGTFVTVVTVLRLQSIIYFSKTTNPTWDNWIISWWSTIEANVGGICTCLPTLRLMLVRVAPRIFSTNGSRNESRGAPNTHGSSHRDNSVLQNKPFEISSIEMSAREEQRWKDSA
ncbi:hypothetical protein E4U21_001536 [Claviceps maximensis]|nr:hypothetical protein E4U21_001536 [Claviceps maximensis]